MSYTKVLQLHVSVKIYPAANTHQTKRLTYPERKTKLL